MSERVEIERVDDGGPAFPDQFGGSEGMSMRDWFAGQALVGLLSHPETSPQSYETFEEMYDELSVITYRLADAMLKARK